MPGAACCSRLAGLLRPEAWLLAAAYWLYLLPGLDRGRALRARRPGRRRAACSGRSATWPSPATPLHSLTFTRDTAETLGRPQGIENVPEIMPRRLGEILRWVPLVGGTAGFFLALRFARERALVPAALAVLGGLAFVAIGIAGLSLLGRYLFLPAAMLAIFFGFAALGWIELPAATAGARWWMVGAAVLLVAFVGSTVSHQTDRLDRLRDGIQLRGEIQDDLRDLTRVDRRRGRCSSAATPCTCRTTGRCRSSPGTSTARPADFVSAQLERAAARRCTSRPPDRRRRGEVRARPARPEAVRCPR